MLAPHEYFGHTRTRPAHTFISLGRADPPVHSSRVQAARNPRCAPLGDRARVAGLAARAANSPRSRAPKGAIIQLTKSKILARTPAGRWGQPEEIAGAAVYLAWRASDFVTGTTIRVDGGYSIR